jgi:hypothetical protein
MLGAPGKQVFEGGDRERALAQENARSAVVAAAWPRTSALLNAIASGVSGVAGSDRVAPAREIEIVLEVVRTRSR